MSFNNKVVIVTGGSAGIGAATAVLFAKEGADVAIVGRNPTTLKEVAEKCASVGNAPLVIRADVSKDDDAKRIIKETIDKYGKLNVLVNNAGIVRIGTLVKGDAVQAYDAMINTNLRSFIQLTSLAAPYLIKTKGNIVNMSSACGAGVAKSPPFVVYSVTKAAIDHFTRGAALELSKYGVRVNTVSPGPVRTGILKEAGDVSEVDMDRMATALGRYDESEDIAEIVLFLASDKTKGVTGSNYASDNGAYLL